MILTPRPTTSWQSHYQQRLPHRLHQLTQFIRQYKTADPHYLRPHFHNLRNQIDIALRFPACWPHLAQLLAALRPLPQLWGLWDEWLLICQQADEVFAQQQWVNEQGWFLADRIALLIELGRHEEAVQVFENLLAIPDPVAAARPLFRAGHTVSTRLILAGYPEQGFAVCKQQSELLYELTPLLAPDDWLYADVLVALQETLVMRQKGEQAKTMPIIEQLIARLAAQPSVPLDLWRDVYHHQGGVLASNSLYHQSVVAMEKAIAYAVMMGDEFYEASLNIDLALPLWALARFDQVETAVRRGIQLCEKLKANNRLALGLSIFVEVLVTRRDLDEAERWLPRLFELCQQQNLEATLADAYAVRGTIAMIQGHYDEALADMKRAEASYLQRKAIRWLVWISLCLSDCYREVGDNETAVYYAYKAHDYCEQGKFMFIKPRVLNCLAQFQDSDKKKAMIREALLLAQTLHLHFVQITCQFNLLPLIEDEAEREVLWQEAIALAYTCGLEKWLEGHSLQNPPRLPII